MKFQVGDHVLILHSDEKGQVVDIINHEMVMVDVRGVKFPAYVDQLDFPYFKQFSEKQKPARGSNRQYIDQLPQIKSGSSISAATGVWVTFLPIFGVDDFGDEVTLSLKIHLVNHSPYNLKFSYQLIFYGENEFEIENQILKSQDFYLHDIAFADINDYPLFSFDFSLIQPESKRVTHYGSILKLKPKQVFKRIEDVKEKGEGLFSYLLFQDYPMVQQEDIALPAEKPGNRAAVYNAAHARRHLEPAKYELDLHIEKISDQWQGMGNFEILTLQLQTFEKYLDLAIAHHQGSFIVIHGVGSGRLRDDIHEMLRIKKEVRSFVNQYHPKYGYGATEIFIQY